ncbi:MAG: 2Fe-2S iron-sulfur cluster-binding protein [Emcibacter sp.]|nr:2Fe-2S iron-sulfur cluster-binding protein [Emcibacter sp.]
MTKITFISPNDEKNTITVKTGGTLMEAAVDNDIPGIDADCGGGCACATCHVYVDDAWAGKLKTKDDMEESMLDFAEEVREHSRLSCQILVTEDIDGIVVTTPESQ